MICFRTVLSRSGDQYRCCCVEWAHKGAAKSECDKDFWFLPQLLLTSNHWIHVCLWCTTCLLQSQWSPRVRRREHLVTYPQVSISSSHTGSGTHVSGHACDCTRSHHVTSTHVTAAMPSWFLPLVSCPPYSLPTLPWLLDFTCCHNLSCSVSVLLVIAFSWTVSAMQFLYTKPSSCIIAVCVCHALQTRRTVS